ncbi:MAG: VOC family protein [Thalassobaculum sp.]|uniref:VOC family protein n=1 Tax=Thalassobaculum sp. TaxID=2022740 RepID=UPI0032ED72EF
MPARDIDHVVVMTRDLESARAGWEQLGFTTTPRAVHPFGTANSLIQLQGNFVELLEIDDESRIAPPAADAFSFAAHNRAFLAAHGEGGSMLVLTSADRDADIAGWTARGLRTYAPFDFERKARLPDGSETRVAFSLGFTGDRSLDGLGFFVCQQHTPEAFWKPYYQRHRNGARRIAAVTLASAEPEAARPFLEGFSGGVAGPAGDNGCYAVALAQDRLDVVPGGPPAIPAIEIAVDDVEAAAALIPGAWRDGPAIVLPSEIANGVSIRLVPAQPQARR